MRHIRRFAGLQRKGMALLLVMFVAFVSLVLLTVLLASVAPRRVSVSQEAQSNRALAAADGTIDYILNQVSAFPTLASAYTASGSAGQKELNYITTYYASSATVAKNVAAKYVMGYLLSTINGGTINWPDGSTTGTGTGTGVPVTLLQADSTSYSGAGTISAGSIWDIEDNIATYFYNIGTQQYYVVCTSTGAIAPVATTGLTTGGTLGVLGSTPPLYIADLNTGALSSCSTSDIAKDLNYATDNQWIEIDANAQYDDLGSGKVRIRTSAYLLSNSSTLPIVRNIVAEAPLTINAGQTWSIGPASGPFTYGVFSGNQLITNHSTLTDASLGSTVTGKVYVGSSISGSGHVDVSGGQVVSSSASIDMSKILHYSSYVPSTPVAVPDFQPGTATTTKAVALAHPGGSSIAPNGSSDINVNGQTGGTAYYTGGAVTIGHICAINLHPIANPGGIPVDWYIDGNLILNSQTTINFGGPGILWVAGDITVASKLIINGSGTIVAGGGITCNSNVTCGSGSQVALISEGTELPGAAPSDAGAATHAGISLGSTSTFTGIFYAPNSSIYSSVQTTVVGVVAAGKSVDFEAQSSVTYDPSISAGTTTDNPVLPGPFGVTVSPLASRSSWKEAIGVPVTNLNIAKLNPTFTSGS